MPGGGYHAVALEQIVYAADGTPQAVRFFDPDIGQIVRMPACDYWKILSEGSDTLDLNTGNMAPSNGTLIRFN
jgi:hypothetical protein